MRVVIFNYDVGKSMFVDLKNVKKIIVLKKKK